MDENLYREFVEGLICKNCESNFDADSLSVMRKEDNCTVVKVTCKNCGKNLGIAILANRLSLNSEQFDKSEDAISEDDVKKAHNFIYGLGNDWIKHLPQNP